MNRQPDLTAQTRANLMDAFWSLYCAKRIEKISVKEIAAKAGYNRGTFYEYFTDVYSVLERLELSILPGSEKELPPRSLTTESGTEQPLDAFIKMYERNRKYFVVLLGEHGDPAFQGRIKRHMKPMLRRLLSDGCCADEFEMDVTIEFVLSAMIGVLSYWFARELQPPSAKLLSLVHDLMEKGALHRLAGSVRS
jgi:AcrR family transcriptional regulator